MSLHCTAAILSQIDPHYYCTTTSSYPELNVVRGTSERMELCHCKGRIREFVTLEKRFIRGMSKGKRRMLYPQFYNAVMFLMSSFSVVENKLLEIMRGFKIISFPEYFHCCQGHSYSLQKGHFAQLLGSVEWSLCTV